MIVCWSSEFHSEGLSGNDEHLAKGGAESEVLLSGPLSLGLLQVTGHLEEVVRHVSLHEGGEFGRVLEHDSPGLKSGDVG